MWIVVLNQKGGSQTRWSISLEWCNFPRTTYLTDEHNRWIYLDVKTMNSSLTHTQSAIKLTPFEGASRTATRNQQFPKNHPTINKLIFLEWWRKHMWNQIHMHSSTVSFDCKVSLLVNPYLTMCPSAGFDWSRLKTNWKMLWKHIFSHHHRSSSPLRKVTISPKGENWVTKPFFLHTKERSS